MLVETCWRHDENKQYVVDAYNRLKKCRDVIHHVLKMRFVTFKKKFYNCKTKVIKLRFLGTNFDSFSENNNHDNKTTNNYIL